MAKFRVYLPLFIFLGFELIAIFAYILATLETRFIASSHIDPHDFPPIVMEHQRGHVSSTVPLGSDKSLISSTPHTISSPTRAASVFPRRIFGWEFERRKNKKAGSKPGEIGSVKGVVVPRIYRVQTQDAAATIRRDSRLFIGDLKPRKIASALFLESFSCFLHGRNNAASIQFF